MSNPVKKFVFSIAHDSWKTMTSFSCVLASAVTPVCSFAEGVYSAPNEFLHGGVHGAVMAAGAWVVGAAGGYVSSVVFHSFFAPFEAFVKRVNFSVTEAHDVIKIGAAFMTFVSGFVGEGLADNAYSRIFGVPSASPFKHNVFGNRGAVESEPTRSGLTREGRAFTYTVG